MMIATKNTHFKKGMLLYMPEESKTVALCVQDSDPDNDVRIIVLKSDGDDRWDHTHGWIFHKYYLDGDYGTIYFMNDTTLVDAMVGVFEDVCNNRGPLCT